MVDLVCCDCRPLLLGYYTNASSICVYGWIDGLCAGATGLGAKSHFYFLDTLALRDLRSAVGTLIAISRLDAAGFDPIRIFDRSFPSDGAGASGKVAPDSISVGDFARGRGEPGEPENGME